MIALLKFEIRYCFCSIQDVQQSEREEQNTIREKEFEAFHESTQGNAVVLQEAHDRDLASLQEELQESQQSQVQCQRQVTTLQTEIEVQRVQIQELMATVSRLSEATCSEGIGSAPTQVGYFDNPDERRPLGWG